MMLLGNAGYRAAAAMETPAYTTPGVSVERHITKPTAMMPRQTKMNGDRLPYRSIAPPRRADGENRCCNVKGAVKS